MEHTIWVTQLCIWGNDANVEWLSVTQFLNGKTQKRSDLEAATPMMETLNTELKYKNITNKQ